MITVDPCAVCASPYVVHLRDVGTSRTQKQVPLHYCMTCQSFTCRGGYLEDSLTLQSDVQYHIKFMDKHRPYLERFVKDLNSWLKYVRPVKRVADVGCGIGHLCSLFTPPADGYDINRLAIEEGRRRYPHLDLFGISFLETTRMYDLVTLIDTCEHIAQPIPFLEGVKAKVNPRGFIYISVPRLDVDQWSFLRTQSIKEQQDFPDGPFHDCDVHVTHYSTLGLHKLADALGMRVVRNFTDYWPLNGILLQNA